MLAPSQVSKKPALALVLACAIASTSPASAQLGISRFTVDGGGGTHSTGGAFGLGGTIGQFDAGLLSGSSFVLKGGFWFGGSTATAIGEGDSVSPGSASALVFRLHPPRPNPVAERTTFAFDLPALTHVRAAIYDVSGRLVSLLADEQLPAGKHQREWARRDESGRLVSSGIYFLLLEAGTHQSRQKVAVVR